MSPPPIVEASMQFRFQNVLFYPQIYLSPNPFLNKDLRAIPFFIGSVLIAILLLQIISKSLENGRQEYELPVEADASEATTQPTTGTRFSGLRQHIRGFGGWTIFSFMLARLFGSLTLLVLSAVTVSKCIQQDGWSDIPTVFKKCPELFLTTSFVYAVFLSTLALLSKDHRTWATRYNITILLSTLGVYAYRDIWPLATYTERPADEAEGTILIYKLVVLTFTAVVIPLFIPRQYVPVDPKHPMATPNPEQTASIFAMLTYTFLDSTILLGYRVPHLSADQLAPLSDHDMAKYRTQKAYPHIDPYHGAKSKSLFWGMMRVYRKEYTILAISVFFYSLGGFAAPIGINRVLAYMETGGAGAKIQPWFWILWLFAGPMIQSLSFQWYIFIATRTLVRAEGLVTQLVFEHSLRIRMKAATQRSEQQVSSVTTPTDSVAVTPDNASAITDPASENTEAPEGTSEGHSQSSTLTVSREASSASTLKASAKPGKGKADIEEKSAKKDDASGADNLVGKINNLVTTDLNNIVGGRDFLLIGLYIPLQITFCMVFLYQVLGWSSLVGVTIMILCLPLPGFIASKLQKSQIQRMKMTDARVQAVSETVNILRMIKLFGWERKMSDRLDKTRQDELYWLWKLKLLDNINGLLAFLYPTLTMLASYALYTLVMKEELTASKIFSSMTVFNMLREQFYRLMRQGVDLIQAKVSLDRVGDFLNNTELLDAFLDKPPSVDVPAIVTNDATSTEIGFRNATFTWSLDEDDGSLTPSRRLFKLRIKDELLFKKDSINLIIGPTGSGKTSILMALLGEMHFSPSNPDSWFNLPREGGVAYAAQESWVQNDTIKNNILFRTPYDKERYEKVLKQCALERDLELFEAGDATEVGERGLTLSGGQKARITLARAIYSDARVILLDDIFAALDVHTSTWIIDHCFKGDLVKNRTILLVTHNVALASPVADFIVSLGPDGKIKSQGTNVSSALKHNPSLAAEVKKDLEATEIGETELELPAKKPAGDGKLVIAEEIAEGHVTWKSMKLLIKGMGGNHPFLFYIVIITTLITVEWGLTFQTWFLGYWGSKYERSDPSSVNAVFYINIYGVLAISVFTLNFFVYLLFVIGSMRASRSINKLLMDSVLGSTLRWLDETPTARIITRCTQDIRTIDSQLPQNVMWLVDCTIGLMTKLGAVVLFTPLFLFPGLAVGVFGFYLGNMYLKAQLSVKRETSNARSPMLAHFSAAIHGIVSIRAYGAQDLFKDESLTRINHYTRVARTSYNLNRWIGVRMDILGAGFTSGLALYLLYRSSIGASNTGFSLAMAADLTTFILYVVRLGNEFEVNSNSLERIQSYLEIEHEPKATKEGEPPAAWPKSGDLRVEHLYARYSQVHDFLSLDSMFTKQTGPHVLHDISFHIQSGQRVGVVGRTGSGKSSMTLALLRCILTEGTVYYDDIPTNTLNLEALRSNITIIPQTPELLSGTLRQNLDPFDQNDDATLNDALRAAGLFSLQEEGDEGRLTLDSVISGGGANLSVGQRQILALARAMVRGSKLLVLDEATSAIDYKTDSIIQHTLRSELENDVTVITVAHRLQTIMDSDRIIVLDSGKMVEFGEPKELLKNKNGILRALVDNSGDKHTLYTLAGHSQDDLEN